MGTPAFLGLMAVVFLVSGAISPDRQMFPLALLFAFFLGAGAFWTMVAGVA